MSHEKEVLPPKLIQNKNNNDIESNADSKNHSIATTLDQKMPPAAFSDSSGGTGVALNYNTHTETSLGSSGAEEFKDPLVVARAILEEHQRKRNGEETVAALLRARQLEAQKQQELELARAIRQRHEDEQNNLLSNIRDRELRKQNPDLVATAVSGVEDPSVSSEAASRKRRLEGDLLRSVLQRRDELTLLNGIRTATRRGNEDDAMYPVKIPRHQSIMSPGASRLIPLTNYENSLASLPPLSSQPSLLRSVSLPSSSSSSRARAFLEDQASSLAGRLHLRNSSQYSSQAILNSLYPSAPDSTSPKQDVSALREYYNAVNASSLVGSKISSQIDSLPSIAHSGVGAEWLRATTTVGNPGLIRGTSLETEKRAHEGLGDLNDGVQIKAADKFAGVNDAIAGDPDDEQQQKRFNKHQCKQWTLKFHELLEFKERTGHCNVPHGYKDNLPLAMWVKRQRHQYNLMVEKKTSTLTGERIKLLENIGFVWNCLETAWQQHFEDLREFVMITGHCAVPTTYKKNPKLASWVVTQRRQCKLLEDGKQSSMTQKRFEKLKQIGFPVRTKKINLEK